MRVLEEASIRAPQIRKGAKEVEKQPSFTIPKLAKMLGVSTCSVRGWIDAGVIAEPPIEPVTQQRSYPKAAAQRIRQWYVERSASGGARGPGASERREAARDVLRREVPFTLVEES